MRSPRSVPLFLAICATVVVAATTLAATPYAATPRCEGVRLRTGPSTSYPTKATLDLKASVIVAAEVSGAHWSTLCGGETYAGSSWAKVVAIDGVSTRDAYGANALYAALGLLQASPLPSGASQPPATTAPTTAPTAAATPTPTATPIATLEPTPPSTSTPAPVATAALASAVCVAVPTSGQSPGTAPINGAAPPSTFGTPGETVLLALALASTALAWVAYREHRLRRRAEEIAHVSAARLDEVRR